MARKTTIAWIVASLAATAGGLPATTSQAADWRPVWASPEVPSYQTSLGVRYWYGWAKTGKDLFDTTGSALVSRLTYDKLNSHAAEIFGRFEHSYGWYVKGFAGGGALVNGTLKDEDFPPFIAPYSSTTSDQMNGGLGYANIDLGINLVKGADFKIGAFVGYHLLYQKVNARGCSQTASNLAVCNPAIITDILVITQNNWWHSLRVGLEGELSFDRFKLNLEGAYLPYVRLQGSDAHWLRIPSSFTGPVPEDGTGWGYHVEAVLSYQVTPVISLGIGGRYWHMETKGNTHFEGHVTTGTGSPQPVNWKTDIAGVFIQANFKLDAYINSGR